MLTIKALENTTPQAIFDRVVAHLRKQGKKSFREGYGCLYRSDDRTCSCAIGCLLSDEEYELTWKRLEGTGVMGLRSTCLIFNRYLMLLHRLQHLHDVVPVENWEYGMQKIAESFSLIYTPPIEATNV